MGNDKIPKIKARKYFINTPPGYAIPLNLPNSLQPFSCGNVRNHNRLADHIRDLLSCGKAVFFYSKNILGYTNLSCIWPNKTVATNNLPR